ncbi:MAG TPA: glutamine--fructose-6-phosphate transaminase (isomerizing) [bacterium]
MCGIVGYIGSRNAVPVLVDALKRQEYRGYDSAGIAVFTDKSLDVVRKKGKIKELEKLLEGKNLNSHIGIGHTRWATHGMPSDENAHPHRAGGVVVVHNGIIENYLSLKAQLIKKKHVFRSQTDTEVIAHLIDNYIKSGLGFERAFFRAIKDLKGSFAIVVLYEKEPGFIMAARLNSPLVVGSGDSENFLASDIPAILPYTNHITIMNDMEAAKIDSRSIKLSDFKGHTIKRLPSTITWTASMAEKEGFSHFMEKEIFEQPGIIAETLRGRYSLESGEALFEDSRALNNLLANITNICIVACGTSYHAGLVGKYIIEDLAGIPVYVDHASEFRYRNPVVNKETLVIAISQSGETADTLAGIREAKSKGAAVISICNVMDSSIPRESGLTLYTRAGPEIGVASTKAYTAQIVVLTLLAIVLSQKTGATGARERKNFIREFLKLPKIAEKILARSVGIRALARKFYAFKHFLYLGRGISFPVAMEGALKLKEISYIHAEAYSAGEMKHGPIALIDEDMPSFFLCPKGKTYEKTLSNMAEVKARDGRIIALATERDNDIKKVADDIFYIPDVPELLLPVALILPLQLFAYYVAVLRGTDLDQPRNLAKSVTVE